LVRPLALIDGVSAPIQQLGAGIEIPVAAPAAGDVLAVVWPPRRGAEPQVPIAHVARRRRLAGEPTVVEVWYVNRGIERVQLAELAAMGKLDRLLKVRHTPPLRAGLKHAAGPLHGVGQFLA